jgi:glycosyltransferase involved in cell wall biosynthesis
MEIDVVIPSYNRLWALERSVPYYLHQQMTKSVIVVNDASTDGTDHWLKEYGNNEPRLRYVNHQVNRGASAARNTDAPLVFFADDDMILRPDNALSILYEELIDNSGDVISPIFGFSEKDSSTNIVFNQRAKNERGLFSSILEFKDYRRLINDLNGNTFECCTLSGLMLMRKEVLNVVRYDDELGTSSFRDETDFQFKALKKGFRLLACPRVYMIALDNLMDKGGTNSMNLFKYELQACRNNWRFLVRHNDVLTDYLDVPYPIEIIQLMFIIKHLCKELPALMAISLLKKACMLLRSLNSSDSLLEP